MNNKQRDSAAKYGYDISKGLALAALVTAVTGDADPEHLLQLVVAAATVFFGAWELET